MNNLELVFIAVALSMDAFAASISKGLCLSKVSYKDSVIVGLFFGGFQLLMPLLGWLLAKSFSKYVVAIDHWIAFGLLSAIGIKTIIDAIKHDKTKCCTTDLLDMNNLFFLAVATSIDALAIGVTFAFLPQVNILFSIIVIGIITFIFSFVGVFLGFRFSSKLGKSAEIVGGLILILIGTKILVEHLGIVIF